MPEGLTDMQNSLEVQSLLHLHWGQRQDRGSHPWCGLIHKPIREQSLECKLSLDPHLALPWKVLFGTAQNKAVE